MGDVTLVFVLTEPRSLPHINPIEVERMKPPPRAHQISFVNLTTPRASISLTPLFSPPAPSRRFFSPRLSTQLSRGPKLSPELSLCPSQVLRKLHLGIREPRPTPKVPKTIPLGRQNQSENKGRVRACIPRVRSHPALSERGGLNQVPVAGSVRGE